MRRYLYLLLITILIFGCKHKPKEKILSMNESARPESELIKLIINKGDTLAYDELRISYLDYRPQDFLPYALIMANKYNHPQACFDVYMCLWEIYGQTDYSLTLLDDLDSITQKMAIDYLKKGVKYGHFQSMQTLGAYYFAGKYVDKNIEFGEQLIRKGDSLQNIW